MLNVSTRVRSPRPGAEERPRRATSVDVARVAGVSRATVSYVLNNVAHQKIPETTRRRVLEAAASLQYAPSATARALRSGRSELVLFLIPDWPIGPALGGMITHLTDAFAREGLSLVVHAGTSTARPIRELWRAITPAAVIAYEEIDAAEADAMRGAGVEVALALLARAPHEPHELQIPQQRSGRMQVEHLAARGHRRLGYALSDDKRVLTFSQPRLDGVRSACADLGLDEPVVVTVPLEARAAAGAVQRWGKAKVTGVCAYNDDVALAVLAGLHRRGLAAPGDLAVVGVDDIPAAALASPPLTTVRTDQQATTQHLVDTVLAQLHGRPAPGRPGSYTVELVVRESA